jgi:CBS domain-containing protein
MYRFLEAIADQYMTRAVTTVTRQTTMRELGALFEKHDFNSFPVVEEGRMLGIVTKFDFLRAFAFTTGQMVPHYDELMRRLRFASCCDHKADIAALRVRAQSRKPQKATSGVFRPRGQKRAELWQHRGRVSPGPWLTIPPTIPARPEAYRLVARLSHEPDVPKIQTYMTRVIGGRHDKQRLRKVKLE